MDQIHPLDRNCLKDKMVLDAGCGNGQSSYWALLYGAKTVDLFDLDERTVAAARKNLSIFRNANVFQQSIYDINSSNKYDFVFSIGVIHHLEDPRLASKIIPRRKTWRLFKHMGLRKRGQRAPYWLS